MGRRWWGALPAGTLVYTDGSHKSVRAVALLCGLSLASSMRKPGWGREMSVVGVGVACIRAPLLLLTAPQPPQQC